MAVRDQCQTHRLSCGCSPIHSNCHRSLAVDFKKRSIASNPDGLVTFDS